MRSRLVPLLLLVSMSVTLGACGGDDGDAADSKATTTESAASDDTTPVDDDPASGLPEGSLPDVGDIPGLTGDFGDCINASAIYSSMMAGLTGSELSSKDQEQVDELRSSLPDDIQDDFDVITDAIAKIGDEGLMAAGQAMSTPEFTTAQQNLQAFFEEECSTPAGG